VVQLAVAAGLCLLFTTGSGVLATQRGPGTPAAPVALALFGESRVVDVRLTFSAKEFDALRPIRVPGGGSSESWLQGAEGRRNGLSASRGIEFPYVHADAVVDGSAVRDIGVRYKGNGTFNLGQRVGKISLKLDFNQFVKGQRLGRLKTLNLHSNVTDASYMNEVLAFRLFREAGVPAPRTSYARVYVAITGRQPSTFTGVFSLVENPDEPFVEARGFPPTGAIFKPVTEQLFRDLGPAWTRYNQTYDPKTDLTPAQSQRVIDFARIVTSGDEASFAREAPNYIDLDNAARYLAMTVWLSDLDGILGSGQNYYLYLDPRTNRFHFIAWDQDHSFGQFFRGNQRQREELDILRPWDGNRRFLARLFALPAFRTRYLQHLAAYTKGALAPDRMARQVDDLAVFLRPLIRQEPQHRVVRFEDAVAGRRPAVDDHMFSQANTPIKPFVVARSRSVAAQLARVK
jgi:hypothetical protein